MPGSVLVMTYDTSSGTYKAQLLGTAQIADLAITSAKLAAEIISLLGTVADGAITSAKIASGVVGGVHIADATITSSDIAVGTIGGIHILDGSILTADLADALITSAKLASGQVGDGHIYPASILSAKIAANIIATPHILNQGILSASIGANVLATPHILNQGILSASLAAGVIGDTLVANFGIVSGKIASGVITEQQLVSGLSIDIAEIAQEPGYRAQDLISAFLGVQFNISGYFNFAQAGDISSMPAVGITTANILSGQIGTFRYGGRLGNAAWDFSGYVGRMLFIGTSSEVTLTAPSLSGQCVQRIGKVIDEDTAFLRPELTFVQIAE